MARCGVSARQRPRDQILKGSFAPLAKFHTKVDADFTYDKIGRPVHAQERAGAWPARRSTSSTRRRKRPRSRACTRRCRAAIPTRSSTSAEQLGKVFEGLSKVLDAEADPADLQDAGRVGQAPAAPGRQGVGPGGCRVARAWSALLKRPFWTLKPDGPFIYEQAEVIAKVTDRLASLGDPPDAITPEAGAVPPRRDRHRLESRLGASASCRATTKAAPAKTPYAIVFRLLDESEPAEAPAQPRRLGRCTAALMNRPVSDGIRGARTLTWMNHGRH